MIDSNGLLERRHVIAGLGASSPAEPRRRAGFRQEPAEVPIGMVLPFSGATGPYGADMKKAADIVVKIINDAAAFWAAQAPSVHRGFRDQSTVAHRDPQIA